MFYLFILGLLLMAAGFLIVVIDKGFEMTAIFSFFIGLYLAGVTIPSFFD